MAEQQRTNLQHFIIGDLQDAILLEKSVKPAIWVEPISLPAKKAADELVQPQFRSACIYDK